jgi:hypothetical protein
LVIRVSSDPAENTSTSPLARALAELEGLAALDGLVELEGLALLLEELLDELLQAVAPRMMQEIDTTAAIRAPRC